MIRNIHLGLAVALVISSQCIAQSPHATSPTASYRIFGIVVDSRSNQPIANARVMISLVTARDQVRSVRTTTDGSFLFDRLSGGKYTLGAVKHGYPEQGYEQHEAYSTAIAVGPSLDSEHIVFRLVAGGSIRGLITSDDNEPVPNASVRLFAASVSSGRSGTHLVQIKSTDDRGYYSLANLPEGNYYIAVSGQPWYATTTNYIDYAHTQDLAPEVLARIEEESARINVVYPLTLYPGTQTPEDAAAIHIASGENATADLILHPVRSLRVRIPSPTPPEPANPDSPEGSVPGVVGFRTLRVTQPQVQLTQFVFGEPVDVFTSGRNTSVPGEYEFGGIAPGHYTVTISRPTENGTASTTQELDIASDTELNDASGTSSSNVSGVLAPTTNIPAQIFAQLVAKGPSARFFGTLIRDGKFAFEEPIPPGTYVVSVSGPFADRYLKSVSAIGARVVGTTIQVLSGQPIQLTLTLGGEVVDVNGVVLKNGKPFAGAMALLIPEDFEHNSLSVGRDQSDSDGTFTFGRTAPGKYKAIAIQDGWKLPWRDPKVLAPYLKNALEVNVAGTAAMNVKLEVQ